MVDLEVRESKNKSKFNIPIWEKYTLTLIEASEYFGIGYKKLKKFVDEHKDEKFILWNGTRAQIKRVLFEQYINEHMDAI